MTRFYLIALCIALLSTSSCSVIIDLGCTNGDDSFCPSGSSCVDGRCVDGSSTDGDADVDADSDADVTPVSSVDILFVVDNSNSMSEEQEVLTDSARAMLEELIAPTDGGGGVPPAVTDLHVGVVTTDMGSGGYTIMTCSDPSNGDNGVLQNTGGFGGCGGTYNAPDCGHAFADCPWLVHSTDHPDDGSSGAPIWDDFACIASLGTQGCGFEQQFMASLVALGQRSEPRQPNDGFLRPDSLLVVIFVTDEDDCSSDNPEVYNPSADHLGGLNTRCGLNHDLLLPVDRVYDDLLALRPGRSDLVIVAAITGVPVDGSWSVGDPLEQLEALNVLNDINPMEMEESCNTAMGLAFPPVRIVDLVYRFGENGILGTICRDDYTAPLMAVTRKIQSKLGE